MFSQTRQFVNNPDILRGHPEKIPDGLLWGVEWLPEGIQARTNVDGVLSHAATSCGTSIAFINFRIRRTLDFIEGCVSDASVKMPPKPISSGRSCPSDRARESP